MKKLVSVMLIILLQVSIVLGYTVTMKVKDMNLTVTGEAGNVGRWLQAHSQSWVCTLGCHYKLGGPGRSLPLSVPQFPL